MRNYSPTAWRIASLYSRALASETRDLAAHIDIALAHERERCAKIAEAQKQDFLSPEYASNQPFGSICERFACDEVAKAIRTQATDGARQDG